MQKKSNSPPASVNDGNNAINKIILDITDLNDDDDVAVSRDDDDDVLHDVDDNFDTDAAMLSRRHRNVGHQLI